MNNRVNILPLIYKCNQRLFSGSRRKYPIYIEEEQKLPVFEHRVSKENYRRIFSWGNIYTGALGKTFKSNEKLDQQFCLRYPKRIKFGETQEVTAAACGFGFTVFAVRSTSNEKIWGTGINTDSQIGYHEVRTGHPLEILFYPKPIALPLKYPEQSKIIKLSAGRAHLLVLTDEGLFTLGNNAYGQCGRKIIPDENYLRSNYINHIEKIDEKKIIDVECGQDHSLALVEDGCVYSCGWGADGQTGLSTFDNCSEFTRVKGDIQMEKICKLSCRSDFVMALNDKGQVFGWGNTEYNQLPSYHQQVSNPTHIEMLDKLGKIKSIASAGSFCLVATDSGQVYSWGYGLLGCGPNAQQSNEPLHIPEVLFGKNDFHPENEVVEVTCGLYYSAAVTNSGNLYVWGRNKYGCLGLGHEKDQYFPIKVAIGGYVEKISCGVDHSIAICKPFI
ncbi:RCC1-like G exchanging factor-like protein [Diorhabda sublineata]|uniref:RCC1-like G exchanging factor-like protein n=1 Tax=Diorhabda sublineata TaxID=1163346 RepID=UPI0024E1688B|nr:RCC1-like G exchanging factor-like protein [Diorhabda sublineata]XP_056635732.1 RCC1-like G exchanging factor-like protein [Diorhabda sublineata]